MSDDDNLCGHWIENLYYFFQPGETFSESKRFYVLHDNDIVYDINDNPLELYILRQKKEPCFIVPCKSFTDEWVKNYYLVWLKDTEFSELRKEGKIVSTKKMNLTQLMFFTLPPPRISFLKIIMKDNVLTIDKGKIPKSLGRNKKFDLLDPKIQLIPQKPSPNEPKFQMDLTPNFPTLKYEKGRKPPGNTFHHGQRKLLLSEIEFLSNINPEKNYIVLYAGAASGDHIPILPFMFPNCYFILFDPSNFSIVPTKKIVIRRSLFDDKIVEEFKNEKVILISDIRQTPEETKTEKEYEEKFEEGVIFDLNLQIAWIKEMQIYSSLLKFRVPFDVEKLTYFNGPKHFQCYAPVHSSEIRLEVIKEEMIVYDRFKYEDQLSFFENIYRPSTFYSEDRFFGRNYDTTREAKVIRKYLEKYRGEKAGVSIVLRYMFSFDEYLGKDLKKKVVPFLIDKR